MSDLSPSFGTTRERGPTVSYAEVERAARAVMAEGDRPTGKAVFERLGRGSPNHINECMRRFWKDQAALNAGDPVALTRLPPEFADAAVDLWERALRLSLQTAQQEGSEAAASLAALSRDTEARARSMELREREWDMAARVRERALADTREQVNLLLKELAITTAEVRSAKEQISELQAQIEDYRGQLATVVSRAVARHRTIVVKKRARAHAQSKRPKKRKKAVASRTARGRRKR